MSRWFVVRPDSEFPSVCWLEHPKGGRATREEAARYAVDMGLHKLGRRLACVECTQWGGPHGTSVSFDQTVPIQQEADDAPDA